MYLIRQLGAPTAPSVAARAKSKQAPRSLAPKLGCRMLPTCPLPRPELSAADWQAYFQRLYGRSGGNNLPSPVGIVDANFPSPEGVDVLNLTLLSNVSAAGASYAQTTLAAFPRHSYWGAESCFRRACDARFLIGHVNVHWPRTFAWRLRAYKYQRPGSASFVGHAALPSGSWAEVTHCGGGTFEESGAWFYAARGSGMWIHLRRTRSFQVHEDAVRHFLRRNCSDRAQNEGMWQCDNELGEMARTAARQGYETLQFLRHCDAKCEQCLHEIVVLRARGIGVCPHITYRRGASGQLPCTCVASASSSVGTEHKPHRGFCVACSEFV